MAGWLRSIREGSAMDVVKAAQDAECERTIDLETELRFEKSPDRRRVLMGELDTLWDTALERGSGR